MTRRHSRESECRCLRRKGIITRCRERAYLVNRDSCVASSGQGAIWAEESGPDPSESGPIRTGPSRAALRDRTGPLVLVELPPPVAPACSCRREGRDCLAGPGWQRDKEGETRLYRHWAAARYGPREVLEEERGRGARLG